MCGLLETGYGLQTVATATSAEDVLGIVHS